MESTIPLLPCKSLEQTLEFYRALGFAVTHEQTQPYLYGTVRRGDLEFHFSSLSVYGAKNAFGASLVFVSEVGGYHQAFAAGLRAHYGKVPTAGLPRITRLRPGQTRFMVFDPSGNLLICIDSNEPETEYGMAEGLSELALALENAAFLRDTYANDEAAAKLLDGAIKQYQGADPIDRARALAARAELAVAMGDAESAQASRIALQQIALSIEERTRFHHELQAADDLERLIDGVSIENPRA